MIGTKYFEKNPRHISFYSILFDAQVVPCFNPITAYPVVGQPECTRSTDINGDGNLDLLVTNFTPDVVTTFTGTGSGTFSGILDLATSASGYGSVLIGIGNGSFTPATNYTTTGAGFCITSGDYDTNGMTDLIVTDNLGNQLIVFLNNIPNVGIISSNWVICSGQSATLAASGTTSYTWSSSSTSQSIIVTPTINTTYSVIGVDTISNCANIASITITVGICSGTNEINKQLQIVISPNPTNGTLKIFSDLIIDTIEIYDISGKQIQKGKYQAELIINSETPGLFLLKIFLENGEIINKRIIKE